MILNLLVLILYYANSATSSLCYWNAGCPYKYFNSKTPYNLLRGDIRDSALKITDCEPVSIWGLVRNGKQYPDTSCAKNMRDAIVLKDYVISSYEKGNSSLCAQDVENLQNWVADEDMFSNPHKLTDEGYYELVGIGRRLKQAFPKLLTKLNKGEYTFRPGTGKWMEDSTKGFVEGLGNTLTVEPPKDGFDIMNPYVTCEKYQTEDDEIHPEILKYEATSEFLASRDRIQRRLGIDYPLTSVNVTSMYDLCRYTTSGVNNKFSPWCALFTSEDLKTLEYLEDLKHYFKNGYGSSKKESFAHIPMADLLKNFQDAIEGNGKKITTYFTDMTMMDMVYTTLSLFKDENPLTGAHRVPDRKWRTSKISIFSSNLLAVLNKCKKDGDNEYNVVFYLNEEPLRPICKDGVCDWQEFVDKLKPFEATNKPICN